MKIYWTEPSPPELASFSAAERKRIWGECAEGRFRKGRTWIGLLALGGCAGAGGLIGDFFDMKLLGSCIGGGIGGLLFSQFAIRSTLEIVREKYRFPQPDHNDPRQ
jgi:hypothetical protein